MCRIAGIITASVPTTDAYMAVAQMCKHMQHGGPDAKGIYQSTDKRITLGNRRLALTDLSDAATQPMRFGKSLTITFNGEIYNHLEIKSELESIGFTFNTMSDTEVILAAYKAWGISSFIKLKGMYAFALADEENAKMYLVRDPFGIKPLYYSYANAVLTFASEVKAFKYTGHPYQEQQNWEVYFLAFGHIPEPYTTIEDVKCLPKEHYLQMDLNDGAISYNRFHKFTYEEKIFKKSVAEAAINKSLRKSVKNHLLSDVPMGLFLSGGIDSSILALIADESTKNLRTLSVNFSEKGFSEKRYQNIIRHKMLSRHSSYTLNLQEFKQNFDAALSAMDQPTNDGLNTWFISKYAKENGLKSVISGIGADELFGGYTSFQRTGIVKLLKMMPNFVLKGIARLPFNSTQRCYFLTYKNMVGEYLLLRGFYTPKVISKLLSISIKEVDKIISGIELNIPQVTFTSEKARISWLETNLYLQNQLLKDTDSIGMSHGVEIRTPFLDVDFVQTCLSIKSRLRFDRRQKKRLLIDAFSDILPKEVWNRPKMGFTFPLSKWLRKIDIVNNEALYQGNATAASLYKKFRLGKLSWARMFVLYQLSK